MFLQNLYKIRFCKGIRARIAPRAVRSAVLAKFGEPVFCES